MSMDETPAAPPRARRRDFLSLAIPLSMAVAALVFSAWPALDTAVSALFWLPDIQDFAGKRSAPVMAMYGFIPRFSKFIIAFLALAFIASLFDRGNKGRSRRIRYAYLVLVLILGPGLVIDVALKGHWGRARPNEITQFGGNARFSAALLPADQCSANCSFVSGHASAGFFFVSLGFLGNTAARRKWTLIGLTLGGIAGLGRISQGGHFLSDVVFAFYFTWFSAWLVWIVFRRLGWLEEKTP
jgi:lipid A 4'-phosphatase